MFDFIIIGGGIIGLSTAMQLLQHYPDQKVLVLEKEAQLASHQTGHNSGVIHAGVYYTPGSLKARFCLEGNRATQAFCQTHQIPFEACGKLIVATNALEMSRMQALWTRTEANGLAREWLNAEQLHEKEPNITGLGAIWVPSTGIVSYTEITNTMAKVFRSLGGTIAYQQEVVEIREQAQSVSVVTAQSTFKSRYMISCSGLMADRIVAMLGLRAGFRICPFRGEYYLLKPEHNQIVNHLIYPVPNPDMPFLGVHLTRMIDGTVTVGPNAVLAWKREGYQKTDFSVRDTLNMLSHKGTLKVLARHLKPGWHELKNSLLKRHYLKEIQKYCPSLQASDLLPYPAGVRAQAVSDDGRLVDDFLFVPSARTFNVCNAPSPAATSALPIGRYIVDQVSQQWSLSA